MHRERQKQSVVITLALSLAACATPEYNRTYDQCSIEAYDRYPTRLEMIQSECSRDVEIDTGKVECVTTYEENRERTVCGPLYETVTETYACEVERDLNREPRSLFARQCAASQCLNTYGNPDCETE